MDTDNPSIGKCCSLHWKGWAMFFIVIGATGAMLYDDCRACRGGYLILIMWISWALEVLPPGIIGMFPVVAYPLMNIMDSDKTCMNYFHDQLLHIIIILMISASIDLSKLNLRVALRICIMFKLNVRLINLFMFLQAVILAQILPQTVAIAIFFPFVHPILHVLNEAGAMQVYLSDEAFIFERTLTRPAKAFYLSLAYAVNIGSSSSQLGSMASAVFRDEYNKRYPKAEDSVEFTEYMTYAMIPMVFCALNVFLYIQWAYLGLRPGTNVPAEIARTKEQLDAGTAACGRKLDEMGPISFAQALVTILVLNMLIMIATMDPQYAEGWGKEVLEKPAPATAATITIALLFALPGNLYFLKCWDERNLKTSPGLINWKWVNSYVSWGLIFIIGCGGTLAEGSRLCGLGREFGERISNVKNHSEPIAMLLVMLAVLTITNFTINTNVMQVLAPGIIQAAVESKVHPLYFGLPSAFIVNIPHLMPQSSVPTAIVAAYARISVLEMLNMGFVPTLLTLLVVYIFALFGGSIFYDDLDKLPDWINASRSVPDYGEKS